MTVNGNAGFAAILLVSALTGCASGGPVPAGELTPYHNRMSDRAIARDLAEFAGWQSRLNRLAVPQEPVAAYHHAKAAGWLALGREEYQVNDQTGIADAALAQARRLITRLEEGSAPRLSETQLPVGSVRLRDDLWDLAEELKDHRGFRCAATAIARLEIELVWAGNVQLTCGPEDPRHHLRAAEIAAQEARELSESCRITPNPEPAIAPIMSKPPAVPNSMAVPLTLMVPNVIHFAFDRATISHESALVLDRIAEVINRYPDLRVVMFGHTDRRGSDTYNYRLARRRADSAHAFLVDKGVDPTQLRVVSEGEARLIRGGESDVEHAYNRRVEFEFYTSVGRRIKTVFQKSDLQPQSRSER